MDRLESSLLDAPIVEKDGYHYFVHPVSDGVPLLKPELLRELVVRIVRTANLEDVEKIVAPEAMGIHIATAVSLATDIPVVVVRKRDYGLDGEVAISQVTGYGESEMYVNGVDPGDRVLVLDDVYSTGGTLAAITEALDDIGAEIVDVVVAISKVGGEKALADSPHEPTALVEIDLVDGEVVIVDGDGDD